jgi:hypothetical protein
MLKRPEDKPHLQKTNPISKKKLMIAHKQTKQLQYPTKENGIQALGKV